MLYRVAPFEDDVFFQGRDNIRNFAENSNHGTLQRVAPPVQIHLLCSPATDHTTPAVFVYTTRIKLQPMGSPLPYHHTNLTEKIILLGLADV